MPLVRIDLIEGKPPEYRASVGQVVYDKLFIVSFAKSRSDSRKYTIVVATYPAAEQPREKYFSTAIGYCFSSSIFGSFK